MKKTIDARNLHVPNCIIPYRTIEDVMELASDAFGLMFTSSDGDIDPNWHGAIIHHRHRTPTSSTTISCLRLHVGNFATADQAECWCSVILKSPLHQTGRRHWTQRATGLLLILDAQLSHSSGPSSPSSSTVAVLKPCTPDIQGVLSALSHFPALIAGRKGETVEHNGLLYAGDHPEIRSVAPLPADTAYPIINQMVMASLRSSPWEP